MCHHVLKKDNLLSIIAGKSQGKHIQVPYLPTLHTIKHVASRIKRSTIHKAPGAKSSCTRRFCNKNLLESPTNDRPPYPSTNSSYTDRTHHEVRWYATYLSVLQRPDLHGPLLLVVRVVGGQRTRKRGRSSGSVSTSCSDRLHLIPGRQRVFHVSVVVVGKGYFVALLCHLVFGLSILST